MIAGGTTPPTLGILSVTCLVLSTRRGIRKKNTFVDILVVSFLVKPCKKSANSACRHDPCQIPVIAMPRCYVRKLAASLSMRSAVSSQQSDAVFVTLNGSPLLFSLEAHSRDPEVSCSTHYQMDKDLGVEDNALRYKKVKARFYAISV